MPELIKAWAWENARVATSKKHRKAVLEMLDKKRVFLDTETNGIDRIRKLRLLQLGDKQNTWLIDPHSDFINDVLYRLFESPITWIAYNASFDMISLGLEYFGVTRTKRASASRITSQNKMYDWMIHKAVSGQVIDPMVTEQVSKSSVRYESLSTLAALENVSNLPEQEWERYAERAGMSSANKYAAASVNDPQWLKYSAHDITQLRAVYQRVKPHLKIPLVKQETAVNVLYEIIKHRGMSFDFQSASKLYEQLCTDREKLLDDLAKYGIHSASAGKQVAAALLNAGAKLEVRTPTGAFQTNKAVLQSITKPKKAKALAELVIRAKSHTKDMGSVANLAHNSPDGSRVYPTLYRIGAITGRSACVTPNLQQLNKHQGDSRVRKLLGADSGDILATVDFDGMELRVIAELSGDPKLTAALLKGSDIHGQVAGMIYGPHYSEKQRNKAKMGVFAMLYGAGSHAIASNTGITIDEADALKDAWKTLYPTVDKVARKWNKYAEDVGFTVLPNGWIVNVGDAPYRAVNYQIQGMAAFIFREAALQAAKAGLWQYVRMVVHDEFVLSLPHNKAKKLLNKFIEAVTVKHDFMIYTVKGETYGSYWGRD